MIKLKHTHSPNFKIAGVIFIVILGVFQIGNCYTGITVESGGGYSSNLYADSFSLGDSYLYGGVSLSNITFTETRLKTYYNLVYYNYDSRSSINQFGHLAGISIFRKQPAEKFNWSVDLAGTYRDYVEGDSDYDKYNIFLNGNLSYYAIPGLQMKLYYQFKRSNYSGFDNLNHKEHGFRSEILKTLPTKTTIRGALDYYHRFFDIDNSKVDWFDLEFKLSQSVDIRTGVSAASLIRLAGSGSRPLSSYYIVSGVTPYWDPWDGYQINLSLKRILPWGVISVADFNYWDRKFNYSEAQQAELPWLNGISERNDDGWGISARFDKQINVFKKYLSTVKIGMSMGYYSNNSDEPYYEYDNFQCAVSLKINLR